MPMQILFWVSSLAHIKEIPHRLSPKAPLKPSKYLISSAHSGVLLWGLGTSSNWALRPTQHGAGAFLAVVGSEKWNHIIPMWLCRTLHHILSLSSGLMFLSMVVNGLVDYPELPHQVDFHVPIGTRFVQTIISSHLRAVHEMNINKLQ